MSSGAHANDGLALVQALLFTDAAPFATLARRAGVSVTVVNRLASAKRHVRLEKFLSAMGQLGLGLLGRTRCDHHWRVLVEPAIHAPLPGGTSLNEVLMHAVARLATNRQWWSQVGLGRSAVQRLGRGLLPPVIETFQRLLTVVEGELVVVAGDGGARQVRLPALRATAGAAGSRRAARRSSIMPAATPRQRGRLQVTKAEILTWHQELRWSCARIAAVAGVSAERVRQILRLFGAEPTRARQRRLRSEAYRQRVGGF